MTNKDTKLLFLDIDDTLLTRDKKLTPGNEAAIREALRRGHKIIITTGRPLSAAMQTIRRLKLTGDGCYTIAYNGALIWDFGREQAIFRQTLPLDCVRHIFARAKEAGFHCQTYDETHVLSPADNEEVRFYSQKTGLPYRVVPELPDSLTEEPVKVLLIDLYDHARIAGFADSLADWAKGKTTFFFSNPYYLEYVKEGLSKGFAVQYLANYLGIPMENTIAAGDSENDISMIKAAHTGCAMANAIDACKEAAGYITENDCDHDGVAEIIRKFIL